MKAVCIIPARGGSKRIPHKNIKDFCGKPIIAYSITNALKSRIFDEVIVSTDDEQIAKIACDYGAKAPFVRPKELSDDFCGTLPVISHAIKNLEIPEYSVVCCLYPTAPLIDSSHILQAFSVLKENQKAHYVFFATAFEKNPYRGFCIDKNGGANLLFPQFQNTRTQDLDPIYSDAGVLYFGFAKTFTSEIPIFSPESVALILDSKMACDIDTMQDWEVAQEKYKHLCALKRQ